MTGTDDERRARRLGAAVRPRVLGVVGAVAAAALTVSCSAVGSDDAAVLSSSSTSPAPGAGAGGADTGSDTSAGSDSVGDTGAPVGVDGLGLGVVDWAVNDGLVSVLVRNETGRVLRRAVLSAQALDSSGAVLASSTETGDQAACCTAVAVPPGETYGFYLAYDGDPDDVDDVVVGFPDVAWSALDAPRGPSVLATPVELRADPTGAVVVADLLTRGGTVDDAVVQATLAGPDGELVSVVSGRWQCLQPGEPQTAYVELFRDVPAGTTIREVSVFALDGVSGQDPSQAPATC